MYLNKDGARSNGRQLKVKEATLQALEAFKPPEQSWDRFLALMTPAIRAEAARMAQERANKLAKSSTTGEKE